MNFEKRPLSRATFVQARLLPASLSWLFHHQKCHTGARFILFVAPERELYFGTQFCNCILQTKSYSSFQCEIGLLLRLERLKCACIIFAKPSCRLHVGHGTRRKAGKYLSLIQNNLLIPVYETRAGKSYLISTVLIYARFRDTPTIFFRSLRQATYQTLPFVYWIMDFLLKARIVHRIFTFLHRVIAKIEGTFSTTIIIE